MTCGTSTHLRVTGALRRGNVLTLRACGCVFSGKLSAVTRVEQLTVGGGICNPGGWWRKRAAPGTQKSLDLRGETGWIFEVAEKAMAQCFPGSICRAEPLIFVG